MHAAFTPRLTNVLCMQVLLRSFTKTLQGYPDMLGALQSATRVKPFICTMPMRLDEGWNQIQFNLADFTRRAYGMPRCCKPHTLQCPCQHAYFPLGYTRASFAKLARASPPLLQTFSKELSAEAAMLAILYNQVL